MWIDDVQQAVTQALNTFTYTKTGLTSKAYKVRVLTVYYYGMNYDYPYTCDRTTAAVNVVADGMQNTTITTTKIRRRYKENNHSLD